MGAAGVSQKPYFPEKTMSMKVIVSSFRFVLFYVLIVRINKSVLGAQAQSTYQETCNDGELSCTTRVAHIATGNQTVTDVANLYTVSNADILGANNLDLTEHDLLTAFFPASSIVLIPLACDCINNTRRTNSTTYTVQPNDFLSVIAQSYYRYQHLTTYQEIGAASALANVNQIQIGQNLTIPFPCACLNNTYKGEPAVFVTTVVQPGSDLSSIASAFGASPADIVTVNEIANVSNILAYSRFAVPLPACQSNFDPTAVDYGLLLTTNSYSLSPGSGCVQSSCYGSPKPALYSIPAPVLLPANAECPSLKCSNSQILGTSVSTSATSNCTTCEYRGYANATAIFTTLETDGESTCPVVSPAPPEREVDGAPGPSGVPAPTAGGPEPHLPPAPGTSTGPSAADSTLDSRVLLRSSAGIAVSIVVPFYFALGAM